MSGEMLLDSGSTRWSEESKPFVRLLLESGAATVA